MSIILPNYNHLMFMLFEAETEGGDRVRGYLTVLNLGYEHIKEGFYISNAANRPFAYKVKPETLKEIKEC